MGIFHEAIEVVVRVPRECGCRYDGQDMILAANYTAKGERIDGVHNMIPKQALAFALAQNPRMGTEDPLDPSKFESVIGVVEPKAKVKKSWHDISFIDESLDTDPIAKMSRVNLREMLEDDPQVKDIKVRGLKQENGVRVPSVENGGALAPRGR